MSSNRLLILLILLALSACAAPPPAATPTPPPSPTATSRPSPTPVPTPTPTPGAGTLRVHPLTAARQAFIPAGDFQQGSDTGQRNEAPARIVWLDDYWLDETEVTNALYAQFVAASGHLTQAEQNGSEYTWHQPYGADSNLDGLAKHPVTLVSWDDAAAYCAWAGGRLPTEAEWEKGARGDTRREYPWGAQWSATRANSNNVRDGYPQTAPVGSFPDGASIFGLLDMAGNVWEWVADWYAPGYPPESPVEHPTGPEQGERRGLRGGSYYEDERALRTVRRASLGPTSFASMVGFRCAYDHSP